MNSAIRFSSQSMHWRTPAGLLEALDLEFHFTFDPAPADPDFDGLMVDWGERNFVNPPYGRELGRWVEKAYREHLRGRLSVLLIPARTDVSWFHDYALRADEIRFVRGRIAFVPGAAERWSDNHAAGRAPFPVCIVIFRGR